MFDGSFKSRPVVSLRGSRAPPPSRDEVLRRAEAERKAREEQRRREAAGQRVTAWSKAAVARLRTESLARAELNDLLTAPLTMGNVDDAVARAIIGLSRRVDPELCGRFAAAFLMVNTEVYFATCTPRRRYHLPRLFLLILRGAMADVPSAAAAARALLDAQADTSYLSPTAFALRDAFLQMPSLPTTPEALDLLSRVLFVVMELVDVSSIVVKLLSRQGVDALLAMPHAPFEAILSIIYLSQPHLNYPRETIECVLANIVLAAERRPTPPRPAQVPLLSALAVLLGDAPAPVKDEDDDDMDVRPLPPQPNAWTTAPLARLRSPEFIQRLRECAIHVESTTTPFASFVSRACLTWPSSQFDILTAGVLGEGEAALLTRVWAALHRDPLMRAGDSKWNSATLSGTFWDLLHFFALAYHIASLSLTDGEFPGLQPRPLDVAVVILPMVEGSFRHGISSRRWSGETSARSGVIRSSLTRLLAHLYDRDSRRPYTQPGMWSFSVAQTKQLASPRFLDIFMDALHPDEMDEDAGPEAAQAASQRALMRNSQATDDDRLVATVLLEVPFMFNFEERVHAFRWLINRESERVSVFSLPAVQVRRDHVFDDVYKAMQDARVSFRNGFKVNFVNEHGLPEAGVGHGLFKECLTLLFRDIFRPERQLFRPTPDGYYYPIGQPTREQRMRFRFIGMLMALALRYNILLEAPFALFVFMRMLGRRNQLDDLAAFDPVLHKQLLTLKTMQNVEDLCLTFSTMDELPDGTRVSVDLMPGGATIPVTSQNRINYIYAVMNYRLNTQIAAAVQAMRTGLEQVIDPQLLRLFSPRELQILVAGTSSGVDLTDLKEHITYGGGYNADSPTIKLLWDVLVSADQEFLSMFLRFVTSCSRPPLLGFKELTPPIAIYKSEDGRLPSAATCINMLKLPPYSDRTKLREALTYAISNSGNFELT